MTKNISDQDILGRLAAMAEEYDPVLKVVEKSKNAQASAYELVVAKGYSREKVTIPMKMVDGWLEQNERTFEAGIRRLISDATDRLDARDYHLKEDQGLWDWTGDQR